MSTQDRAALLADMAGELKRAPDDEVTAKTMVARTLDLLPRSDAVSLTVRGRHGRFATLGATDQRAERADELQYDTGEGPCLSAVEQADWFRSGDVSVDARWPTWGPRVAAEVGVRSLLSVRLMGDEDALGALNVYGDEPGLFTDPDDIDLLLLFATHAAIALSAAREISGLQTAVHTRHVIGLSQGILMERYDLTADQAFALLRRYSNDLNVKLHDVAYELATNRELPDLPGVRRPEPD
jgi:GAF domain-containing protein